MKVNFIKQPGGVLIPADDMEVERLTKFKTGEMYEVEIKLSRNPVFHKKVFVFMKFCFDHWRSEREFLNEQQQFECFRNNLTVLAGYYTESFKINGEVRIEAKSLSFGSMDQETFEACYNAMITAACKHIFQTADDNTYNQLLSFFN
jgi:hypothetical protein